MKHLLYSGLLLLALTFSFCSKKSNLEPEEKKETPQEPAKQELLSNDISFKAPTSFTSNNVFVQPDGKVLVDAYTTVNNVAVIKIHRLNTDGSLDNTFNIDADKTWLIKSVTGIFVLADGKVLLGGEFTVNGKTTLLVRLTNTGALDPTYISPNINSTSVRFQRTGNGKVLVVLISKVVDYFNDTQTNLIRLNSDGSLDASFAVTTYNIPAVADDFVSIVPLTNGKILVSGYLSMGTASEKRNNIIRLNDDGSVDFTFNFKETPSNSAYVKMAVQSDGKIIIAGAFNSIFDPNIRDANYPYTGIARINSDGSIDHSFKSPAAFSYSNTICDITTLSDNRILAIWKGIYGTALGKDYVELHGANGGIDNSYNYPYQYGRISNIFRISPDNFLLVGKIPVNGVTYPVIRLKKM